jgi:hypothetical protein
MTERLLYATIIQTKSTFITLLQVNRFPQTLLVQPGVLCGSTSYAFGSGISSAIVAYAALFTVQAVDNFGNSRTSQNNVATGSIVYRLLIRFMLNL